MSMRRSPWLIVALALVVGAAIALWLGSQDATNRESRVTGAKGAVPNEGVATLQGHGPAETTEPFNSSATGSEASGDAEQDEAERRVQIVVVDTSGKPVDGAIVGWLMRRSPRQAPLYKPEAHEGFVPDASGELLMNCYVPSRTMARTDANGRAMLKAEDEWAVGVRAAPPFAARGPGDSRPNLNDRLAVTAVPVDRKQIPDTIEIEMDDAVRVVVRTVGPEGRDRPNSPVYCKTIRHRLESSRQRSDETGRLELRHLSPRIPVFVAPQLTGFTSRLDGQWYSPTAGEITIEFPTKHDLQLFLPDARPGDRVHIRVSHADTGEHLGSHLEQLDNEHVVQVGSYPESVPLDIVVVSHRTQQVGHGKNIAVRGDPSLMRLEDPMVIAGRVVDDEGFPVAGAHVYFSNARGQRMTARTSDIGLFRAKNLLPGEVELIAHHDKTGRFSGAVQVRDATESLEIRLAPATRPIVLHVRMPEGHNPKISWFAGMFLHRGPHTIRIHGTWRQGDDKHLAVTSPSFTFPGMPPDALRIELRMTSSDQGGPDGATRMQRLSGMAELSAQQDRATIVMKLMDSK